MVLQVWSPGKKIGMVVHTHNTNYEDTGTWKIIGACWPDNLA